jgi:hypothetical protein
MAGGVVRLRWKLLVAAPFALAAGMLGHWLVAGRFPADHRVVVRLRNGTEIHGRVVADGLLATAVTAHRHGRLSWPFWRIEDVWDVGHDYQTECLHGCVERP